MGSTTGIQWATATWNPWQGCQKVSQGCAKCYAEREMTKYGRSFRSVVRSRTTFDAPLRWARGVKDAPPPGSRIFTCSWSDWFIEQADPWRDEAWSIIEQTPQYTYLILTKRPERIIEHLPPNWGHGYANVWLGVSAESQEEANLRIPQLCATPAQVRFVSAEPLLGPIDFERAGWTACPTCGGSGEVAGDYFSADGLTRCQDCDGYGAATDNLIHWVITGGESDDQSPRPTELGWLRSIRDDCVDQGVSYFHKQNGGRTKCRCHNAWGCRGLDGRTWDELPESVPAPAPPVQGTLL